jgi:hypothetical protein
MHSESVGWVDRLEVFETPLSYSIHEIDFQQPFGHKEASNSGLADLFHGSLEVQMRPL